MSRIFPTPPRPHLLLTPCWSLCFRRTRWFSHRYLFVLSLQVFPAHRCHFRRSLLRRARPRCPRPRNSRPLDLRSCRARTRCLLLRHARPRCLLLRHAWPRCLLRRLRATPSQCRCTGVVRCQHRRRTCGLQLRHRSLHRHVHRSRHRSRLRRLALELSRLCTTRQSSIGTLAIFIPW